jgi:hypothetical protein
MLLKHPVEEPVYFRPAALCDQRGITTSLAKISTEARSQLRSYPLMTSPGGLLTSLTPTP